MNSFWQQMPFVRILAAFIFGIIWKDSFACDGLNLQYLLVFFGVLIFLYFRFSRKLTQDFIPGFLFFILFFLLGAWAFQFHHQQNYYRHFSLGQYKYLCLQINEKPSHTNSGYKSECLVLSGIDSNLVQHKSSGKILIYFNSRCTDSIPAYGQVFIIKSGFQEFSLPRNPYAFDYKRYMSVKGVFHSQYLRGGQWVQTEQNRGDWLIKKVNAIQKFIQLTLKNNLKDAGEIAVAEALLYGYDKGIDDELTDAYSKTGTLHVLAVSGMHVGMIFLILGLFLRPLKKVKKGELYSAIIQLFGIWAYSLICGFSPSILRATVMFSFVIIGKMIRRNGNPFNSLSASAFFLLMFDPMMIFQVGFQLSYAAVLGILSFYPSIYFLFEFRRQFWDEIWKILAVSIAAQTLTLPMSIFYFHQFPNYFLLANLLIIPLTSLIIYLGIFLLFISPFSFLSIWVGKLIGILIQLTNSIAKGIANLPYSYLENLNWDIFTIIGFYGMVICGVIYFSKRDLLAMQFLLVLVLGLQVQKFYQHNQKSKQHFATIYDVKGGFGLQYGKGGKAIVLQNKSADSLGSTFIKLTQIHQLKLGLEQVQKSTLDSQNYLCELKPGYKLFFIQQNEVPLKEEFEILVVSGNQFIKLEEILANNVVKMVVLNHDMPYKKRLFIKKYLAIHKIPFHDIAEKGAFEVSL